VLLGVTVRVLFPGIFAKLCRYLVCFIRLLPSQDYSTAQVL